MGGWQECRREEIIFTLAVRMLLKLHCQCKFVDSSRYNSSKDREIQLALSSKSSALRPRPPQHLDSDRYSHHHRFTVSPFFISHSHLCSQYVHNTWLAPFVDHWKGAFLAWRNILPPFSLLLKRSQNVRSLPCTWITLCLMYSLLLH